MTAIDQSKTPRARVALSNRSQVGDIVRYQHRHGQRRFAHEGEVIQRTEISPTVVRLRVRCCWSIAPGRGCIGTEQDFELRRLYQQEQDRA